MRRKSRIQVDTQRSFLLWLLALAAIAFVIRVVAARQIGDLPISQNPHYDSLEYLTWAQRIASGDFTWPAPPPHGPGYPFFLAALLALTNGSLFAVRIVQAALGAMTCCFVAWAGARLFGRRAGLAAAGLLAIYSPLIWIDVSIYAEGLLIFLISAALWSAVTDRHGAITGGLLGAAALVRPTALVLFPLLVFAVRGWRARAWLTTAMLLAIMPATIANWRAMPAFIPIQAFGGMNYYLGNSPLRDGLPSARPGGDWDRIEPEAARNGALSPLDEDRYFVRKAEAEIMQHPLGYVRLLLRKTVWTFQADEIRDTHSFYFFRQFAPLLWLPSFTILFALGVAGSTFSNWRDRSTWIVSGYVLLTAATCVFLVVGSRYRLPIVIGLALLGGVALMRAAETPTRRQLAMLGAVTLVAGACTRIWRHLPDHNFSEEWALTAESQLQQGDIPSAEKSAKTSLELDRDNALAWDASGVTLGSAGRESEAIAALVHAITLNPDFVAAHLHLAETYERQNGLQAAAVQYERALAIDPRDPRPIERLAAVLVRQGQLQRAAAMYARLVQRNPRDADAIFALARLDGALGRPREGFEIARRASSIRELTAEEWTLIALLASQSDQLEEASAAAGRARALGGDTAQTMFVMAYIEFRRSHFDNAESILDQLLARAPQFAEAKQLKDAIEKEKKR
jgi:tetratricopeptide (TPR) repeat protein